MHCKGFLQKIVKEESEAFPPGKKVFKILSKGMLDGIKVEALLQDKAGHKTRARMRKEGH